MCNYSLLVLLCMSLNGLQAFEEVSIHVYVNNSLIYYFTGHILEYYAGLL